MQRLESERRAVQIMTIHKAKGLEASIVFMAGGWTRGGGDDVHVYHEGERRLAWVGGLRSDVKALVRAEEEEEDQRLMYVALTRAKGRLYVPSIVRDGKPPRLRGPYEVVNRRVFELVAAESPLVTVEEGPRLAAVTDTRASDPHADPWSPPIDRLEPDRRASEYATLRERHAGAIVTSYTRMKGSRSGADSAWSREPADTRAEKGSEEIETAPPTGLRSTRASGVFVHEVLERVPLASFAAAPDFASWRARREISLLFDEAIAVHRVDPAQRDHAEQLAWAAYTTAIVLPGGSELDRVASAGHVAREMEFVFPVAEASAYVRGSIDLAFEHAGLTYFVDWKTDSLPSYDVPALGRHVAVHYEEQLELYALATVKLLGIRSREEYDARFGGLLYCFLRGFSRGAGVWTARPSWEKVVEWGDALGRRAMGGRRP
jgi:exodeoxyribonuclease V beta subunit